MNWKGRNEKGTGLKTLQEKKKKKKKRENKQRKKTKKTNKQKLNELSLTIKVFGFEFSFLSAKGVGQFMAGNLVQQASPFSI